MSDESDGNTAASTNANSVARSAIDSAVVARPPGLMGAISPAPSILSPPNDRRASGRVMGHPGGGSGGVFGPRSASGARSSGSTIPMRRRVLVCHSERLVAEAIAATLRNQFSRFDIVVETSLDALLQQLQQRTDVVVLGVDVDSERAFELLEAITHRRQQVPVLLVRPELSVDVVARDLERGVIGVAWLGCRPAEMVAAVTSAMRREPAIPAELTAAVLAQLRRRFTRRSAAVSTLQAMSVREREVLVALVAGRRRPDIAEQMGVSHHTVRTHIHRVLSKLSVSSQLEAAAVGRKLLNDLDPTQLAMVASSDFNRWDAAAN
jgi:DNA-binding NarL/FixJ family response regulator